MAIPPDNLIRKLLEIDNEFESLTSAMLDPVVMTDHRRLRGIVIRRSAMNEMVMRWRRWNAAGTELACAIELAGD